MRENPCDESRVAKHLPVIHQGGSRSEGGAAIFRQGFPEKDDHNERKQGAEEREKREYEAPAEKDGEFSPDNRRHAGPDAEKNCNEGENPGGFNPLPLIAHNGLGNHRSCGSAEPHQKAPAVERLNRICKHASDGGKREDDRGGYQHPAAPEGI